MEKGGPFGGVFGDVLATAGRVGKFANRSLSLSLSQQAGLTDVPRITSSITYTHSDAHTHTHTQDTCTKMAC